MIRPQESFVRRARARRKFVFGVLEQAANILGAMTASVLVVGLLLPALGAFTGHAAVSHEMFGATARLVLGFAAFSATGSLVLRGLARRLEDDSLDIDGHGAERHDASGGH